MRLAKWIDVGMYVPKFVYVYVRKSWKIKFGTSGFATRDDVQIPSRAEINSYDLSRESLGIRRCERGEEQCL